MFMPTNSFYDPIQRTRVGKFNNHRLAIRSWLIHLDYRTIWLEDCISCTSLSIISKGSRTTLRVLMKLKVRACFLVLNLKFPVCFSVQLSQTNCSYDLSHKFCAFHTYVFHTASPIIQTTHKRRSTGIC